MGEAFVYLNFYWLVINFVNTVGRFRGCKVIVSNHELYVHCNSYTQTLGTVIFNKRCG